MTREALRSAAQSRRENQNDEQPEAVSKLKWHCDFCSRPFSNEVFFMNHKCKDRDRLDTMQTPLGQSAYAYYSEWMRVSKKSVPPHKTFLTSRFYTTFIKFAEYAEKTNLPSPNTFIKFMVSQTMSPTLWSRDNVYAMYMQSYDAQNPPCNQFIESLDFALKLCSDYGCEPSRLFDTISPHDLERHIRKRKLSVWFLLASKTFKTLIIKHPDQVIKARLQDSAKLGAMIDRISNDTARLELKQFEDAASEIGF